MKWIERIIGQNPLMWLFSREKGTVSFNVDNKDKLPLEESLLEVIRSLGESNSQSYVIVTKGNYKKYSKYILYINSEKVCEVKIEK